MSATLSQVSTLRALLLGNYQGVVDAQQLAEKLQWGIGTYEGLDGEAIFVDGTPWVARPATEAVEVEPGTKVAFAAGCAFGEDAKSVSLGQALSLPEFKGQLELLQMISYNNPNEFYVVALKGEFPFVHVRSCKKQEPPYQPLDKVIVDQVERTYKNVSGTVVGVWYPQWAEALNMPGWHLHFISDDRRCAGHLLALESTEAHGQMQNCCSFNLRLPENPEFAKLSLAQDLSRPTGLVEG